jgi:DNA repair protein RecN
MLQHLQISNYALIESLSVAFEKGFSVITGETGAGKSILLGALGFVLGDRADTNVLYDKDKKCVVEATFDLQNEALKPLFDENDIDFSKECIFRRELSPLKKSRAFINDIPVSLQVMKDIGNHLIDIHSQHDSLLLTNADFQMQLLDNLAKNESILSEYKSNYATFNAIKRKLDELHEMAAKNSSENEYLKFQLEELEKAQLKNEEFEELNQTLEIMENAEEIKSLLFSANSLLENSDNALLSQIVDLSNLIGKLKAFIPETEALTGRVESLRIELKDIAYDLSKYEEDAQFDEDELRSKQERQDFLNRLMMKHHVNDFSELLELKEDISEKVNAFENIDSEIEKAEKVLQQQENTLRKLGKDLHARRVAASKNFEEHVTALVKQLAMPHAVFKISCEILQGFAENGMDKIKFLFSANKGVEVNEIERVASGGELSRLMLSIKSVVSEYNYIPTLVFDEIDTGVSGEVAAKLGSIMDTMSEKLQLISITHLPQIASKAAHHFFVYKDNRGEKTHSCIRTLSKEERITEIAKMLSNDKVSDEALKAAKVLLN